jgi:hypothetical protein
VFDENNYIKWTDSLRRGGVNVILWTCNREVLGSNFEGAQAALTEVSVAFLVS